MANYPKEFEDLLQEYLTDGIITEQERKVLLRKAEKLGLDVEEIDLYITAQEQKVEQATDAAVRKKKGQTCPYCGGSVPQLTDKCPHCGQHITVEASDELKEIIENLEEALVDFKSGKDFARSKANVEKYMRKAQLYFSSNPKVKTLIEQVKQESEIAEKKAKSEARKKTLIGILTYNKWLTLSVGVVLIIAVGIGIVSILHSGPEYDTDKCIYAISKAISKGDITKAEALRTAYLENHKDPDDPTQWSAKKALKEGSTMITEYYIDNDIFEKAEGSLKYLVEQQDKIYAKKLIDVYMDKGMLDKAESLIETEIQKRSVLESKDLEVCKMKLANLYLENSDYSKYE